MKQKVQFDDVKGEAILKAELLEGLASINCYNNSRNEG